MKRNDGLKPKLEIVHRVPMTPDTVPQAQHIANHESPRTTKLYDRRQDDISLDEVERIAI